MALWTTRKLSLEGKVLVLKAICLPILMFIAMIFPPSYRWTKVTQRLFANFFWGSKIEKLKRDTVFKLPTKGGKDLPNLHDFLMSHFVKNVLGNAKKDSHVAAYTLFATSFILSRVGICKLDNTKPFLLEPPPAYKGIKPFFKKLEERQIQAKDITPQMALSKELKETD